MKQRSHHQNLTFLAIVLGLVVLVGVSISSSFSLGAMEYFRTEQASTTLAVITDTSLATELSLPKVIITHRPTPTPVRAVYMSSWVAGTKDFRDRLINKITGTEINSVVIDIKDYSGKIVVKLDAPSLIKYNSFENRVPDITEFVAELHQKGFYVIGRISVFQDNFLARERPDLALRRKDNNAIWEDKKGITWLDVSLPEVWEYAVVVAREGYAVGFDELNFDYVRFPSDGDVTQIRYRHYDETKETKPQALEHFFVYLQAQMKAIGAPTSANVFGMVTTNTDDLGIGQVLESIAPYVDYVSPMVYPSHYPPTWNGFKSPANNPYEVIKISLDSAVTRLEAQGLPKSKIRPWLQDFDLGATYTAEMIKAEHQAVYDTGLDSWMMWDPKNLYTMGAYQKIDN